MLDDRFACDMEKDGVNVIQLTYCGEYIFET